MIVPSLPNARYSIALRLDSGSVVILSGTYVTVDMRITKVFPGLGSIGGGTTVKITGSGFSPIASRTSVFMTVPVSTTWLNGIIPCDVVNSTATEINCVTRAHLAADASADDAMARNVMPVQSKKAPVQVGG